MTNGRLIIVVGGAALGGLLVGGVISGGEKEVGVDLRLEVGPSSGTCTGKQQAPPSEAVPPRQQRASAPKARQRPRRATPPRPSPTARHNVAIHAENPTRGPATAKVTIVSFTDFQCAYCARAAQTMDKVHKTYGDQVRIVLKHHPLSFHRDAPLAHQAAAEAHAQGKFWAYHDRLFASRALKRADLEAHAEALRLDLARFRQALDTGAHAPLIDRDIAQARSLGATGTPAFFINGRFVSGARSFETFKQLIDEELGR